MKDFPKFMKGTKNAIGAESQSKGVSGWLYEGAGDKQMAYWICDTNGTSDEHSHDFDEYFVVVQGTYTLIIGNKKITMNKGDEYYIPKGTPHSGEFTAGTRTIHCFGGKRAGRA